MFSKPNAALLVAAVALHSAAATDYAGGWVDADTCVDICSAPAATCLTKDAACLAKEKVPGDFDYLVLEQLFVPQFCRDLLLGYDSTVSHQNVNPYPNGTACVADRVKSELTIHGLWPNYDDGYVSCCNPSDTVANDPYDAAAFSTNQAELLAEMGSKWVDATASSDYDTLCEIYDHEFQKHGLCYAAQGADLEAAAVTYFQATLNTADRLSAATEQINAWAAQETPETTVEAIKALYDYDVIVLCSSVDEGNQLSVIRTCYDKPSDIGAEGPTTQSDCGNITASSPFKFCSESEPVTLLGYVDPDASTTSAPTATPDATTATPDATTATPAVTTATPDATTAAPAVTTSAPTTTPAATQPNACQ